jgi:bacteriorhodopsin
MAIYVVYREKQARNTLMYAICFALIGLVFASLATDKSIMCWPSSAIQAHSFAHLMTGLAAYAFFELHNDLGWTTIFKN